MRVDERLARRRDLPRRLRGHRVARRRGWSSPGRRPARRAAGVPVGDRRSSACASGSAWPGTALGAAGRGVRRRERAAGGRAGARRATSGSPRAGCPRCWTSCASGCRRRWIRSPARRRWRWRGPDARVAELGADAGRERAPAAAAVRRRGRLRAEDARPRAALPAVPGARGAAATSSRALAFERGLRRPGAPHARVPAALPGAHAGRAGRVRARGAGGRAARPFRSSQPARRARTVRRR